MSDLPFDPSTSFGAVFSPAGEEWPWLFFRVGVMELHRRVHDRPLLGEVVIEKGPGDEAFDAGPTLLRCQDPADLDAAAAAFLAWEARA